MIRANIRLYNGAGGYSDFSCRPYIIGRGGVCLPIKRGPTFSILQRSSWDEAGRGLACHWLSPDDCALRFCQQLPEILLTTSVKYLSWPRFLLYLCWLSIFFVPSTAPSFIRPYHPCRPRPQSTAAQERQAPALWNHQRHSLAAIEKKRRSQPFGWRKYSFTVTAYLKWSRRRY